MNDKLKLESFLGETNLYDKKEKLEKNKPKSWLKSVSAFANSKGGKLLFGVKEDNTIVGLEEFQKDSEYISETIKTKVDPIPEFDMEFKQINDRIILILDIYQGKNTPYFVIDSGSRTAFKRVGNQSVVATRIDLLNLSLKAEHVSFDSLEFNKTIEDVTFKELEIEYKNRTSKRFETKDLISFGLINENGHLTIAGALFADGYQVYQSRVFCTRWNGLTKANGRIDALDDQEFEGNIIYLLKASLDFVKRNSKKMWEKGPIYRIEYPEYPERAVQEAIVNALIHRDYSVVGSEVHIDIYDDRLEIFSPGGMADLTFIQDLNPLNVSSVRRNPILADLFARMDLMERRGSGLRKIIEAYEAEENFTNKMMPEFVSTETKFIIILKNLNYSVQKDGQVDTNSQGDTQKGKNDTQKGKNDTQNDTQKGKNDTQKGKNDTQKSKNDTQNKSSKLSPRNRRMKILDILENNPKITAQELAEMFLVSKITIRRDMKILVDEGKLEYVGSSRSGFWKIK
ncbi:helix-turn-helix domain-containing protein [Finegoldia magna]|uniref:AAA family ATPase n=1 Tax=Finegoldia magna TaxID=1260 RepID=A0A233VB82_FINMA|nr:helix-turn-helix domain-containing protein [Finegoldia magna]OXZ29634.1 AAA family ATPase [Finegoldia magna]OXZ35158.1 AAA family ATPase [Finegoldia magna]